MKLYAKYSTPGILFPEETSKEVSSLADAVTQAPSSAFCFTTFRLPEIDFEYDESKFTVIPQPQQPSEGSYYLGGVVYSIDEIRKLVDEFDPTGTLLVNMEGNGWDHVIKCRTGNFQPFILNKDSLLDPTEGKEVEINA